MIVLFLEFFNDRFFIKLLTKICLVEISCRSDFNYLYTCIWKFSKFSEIKLMLKFRLLGKCSLVLLYTDVTLCYFILTPPTLVFSMWTLNHSIQLWTLTSCVQSADLIITLNRMLINMFTKQRICSE